MYTSLYNTFRIYAELKDNKSFIRLRKKSQEWGWGDDVEDPENALDYGPEISLDQPSYINYETQAVRQFLDSNGRLNRKLQSLAKNTFNRTHSSAAVESALVDYLQSTVFSGARKLKEPYASLVSAALDNVYWESVVSAYLEAFTGPEYMSDDDELDAFNKLLLDYGIPDEAARDVGMDGYIDDSGEFVAYGYFDDLDEFA